jgi:tetratricopeptide (TPR) repeat protein
MELTIEQVLQQGVAAHKSGNLQEAERLYRAILQSQPTHPDANHNIGLIAISVNQIKAALPLFKIALDVNPNIEQFWLSYIDALIKEQQFEAAKQVLEQAKKQCVAVEKLNVLEAQLASINKQENVICLSPSQQQLSNLLEQYQNGRFADAEELAVSITEQFPKHQFAWKVLGAIFGQTGRKVEAANANQKAVALSTQDAEAHYNLGNTLQALGRLQEAEASYTEAIVLKPDFAKAHSNLGNTLQEQGRLEEAKASYTQAIALKPDFVEAHYNLGNTLQALGRLQEAEASYTEAIVLKPDFAKAHSNLGNTLQALGRLQDAEASYRQAIALKPDYAEAHSNLGNTLQQLGRLDESEASLKQAIALKPDYSEAHSNLGNTLQEQGRLEEAEASYRQAIALKPDYAEAHSNLGNTLQEQGRLEEAEASLKQAIALKPDYSEAHSNLGNTLNELDRLEEAEASYTQAIALKPDYAEAHSNLGVTLQELGRLEEAEASYGQAIALKPDYAEPHNNLGNTLKELGRLDEAEASHTQAIALKPDYAEAHYNFGIMLQEQGRLDEAEASYTQAIALKPDYVEAHSNLLKCLYLQDKRSLFIDELDYLINQDKANAVIGSLTCRSALKYGLEKPNLFCREPLKYVLHIDMNTQYDFEEIFVEKARSILNENRISNRKQSLLVNGYQTSGNLFAIENSFTEKIQKAIRLEIEKYHINFKNSEEGLIKKWPTEYSLYGWLVSMKSGGEIQPHIHEEGWLSGSVYINIPRKSKADSGNLVVSLGEEKDATDTRINVEKIINVVTGSLVLFPASLTHYTIPFEAEEERIVLAFDVKQK